MQTLNIRHIQSEQKMHSPTYRRWIYTTKKHITWTSAFWSM